MIGAAIRTRFRVLLLVALLAYSVGEGNAGGATG
jgi:hypothetical protein